MERSIFMVHLENIENQTIEIHKDAQLLSAQLDGNKICLYYLVNPNVTKKDKKRFLIFRTGQKVDWLLVKGCTFITTLQRDITVPCNVIHLFEKPVY
jgi:hypothetical protein